MSKASEGLEFFISQVRPNLQEIASAIYTHLTEQYESIGKQAEQHLIGAARNISSEHEKERFISAIEQCQRFRNQMRSAFSQKLIEALKPLDGQSDATQPELLFEGSISALASQAREDEKYISQVAEKANQYFTPWIEQISDGFRKALPDSGFNVRTCPVSPTVICNALYASLQMTSMHSMVKREILALYNDQLVNELETLYNRVIRLFAQSGFKVTLPNAGVLSEETEILDIPVLEPEPEEIDTISGDFNELIESGTIPSSYENLGYTVMQDAYKNSDLKVNHISEKEIDKLLASMQKGYDPKSDGHISDYLKSQLDLEATEKSVDILTRHNENIINLVSLVIDQISETQDEKMADLFCRLKVPYTRLILSDELFFHDSSHPARLLLDQLMTLTYSSDDHELLYSQVQNCVTKLLMRYKGDHSIFEDLLGAVETQLESNQKNWNESCQALQEHFEHQENFRMTSAAVRKLIDKRSSVLTRKLRFHTLMEKFWEQILTNIYLSEGKDSKLWTKATSLLDISIILTHDNSKPQFEKFSNDFARAAAKASKLLADQDIDEEWRSIYIKQFQELHDRLKSGSQLSDIDDDDLSYTFDVDMIIDDYESEMVAEIDTSRVGSEHKNSSRAKELELIPKDKRLSQEQSIQMVNSLKIGQWMNFIVDNERTPSVISYFSQHKKTYTFCNRHNEKLFERKKSEIAKDIYFGYACPLENTLCFDGNLARVISRLNHT